MQLTDDQGSYGGNHLLMDPNPYAEKREEKTGNQQASLREISQQSPSLYVNSRSVETAAKNLNNVNNEGCDYPATPYMGLNSQ